MSADKYPLPSYAVSAWVVGDDLLIAFPSSRTEKGHTIKLPASAGGLHAAITILKARSAEQSHLLGERGTPTAYEMETALSSDKRYGEWLKAMNASNAEKVRERDEATEFLKELGL
jgi:hypothetical protein